MDGYIRCIFSRAFGDDSRVTARAIVAHDIIDLMASSLGAFVDNRDPGVGAAWAIHGSGLRSISRDGCAIAPGKLFGTLLGCNCAQAEIRKCESCRGGENEGEASECFHILSFYFVFQFSVRHLARTYQTPPRSLIRKRSEKDFSRVSHAGGVSTMWLIESNNSWLTNSNIE